MKENYTDFVTRTATYPNRHNNILYPMLGLISEAGEAAEKILAAVEAGKVKVVGPSDIAHVLTMMVTLGDCASTLKKAQRDKNAYVSHTTIVSADLAPILKELGDCQWYLEALSQELCSTGEADRSQNVEKLTGRLERGTVNGDGDDR